MPRILKIAALALAVLLLAACSVSLPEERPAIKLMHGWGGASRDHIAMRSIYEDFTKQNPDIDLVFDASPDLEVVLDKANDMLAVGRMDDIVSTNGYSDFLDYAKKRGMALNLMPYIEADGELRGDIPQIVLDSWQEGQAIYTLPDALEVSGYWYNPAIFASAGIDEPPRTWDEFWAGCEKISDWSRRTGKDVYALAMEPTQAFYLLLGARIAGESAEGRALMEKTPSTFQTEAVTEALDDIVKAFKYCAPDSLKSTTNDALDKFNRGKAAIYFNGVWANEFFDGGASVKPAVFPGYGGNTVSYVCASSGYVLSNAGNEPSRQAALRFLKYMLSDETQTRILTDTRQAPSNPGVDINLIAKTAPLLYEAVNCAYGASIQIRTLRSLWPEQVVEYITQNLPYLVEGSVSAAGFAAMMDECLPAGRSL